MNKARRHELKMLKYKKRLKLYKIDENIESNFYALRSHSVPCSCWMCSYKKYSKKDRRNSNKIEDDENW